MVRDKAERLVNLTSALLENPQPLTFEQIRDRLRGTYDQDDSETARRMFERDKKELRGLNIPVTTSRDFFTGVEGYTIDRRAYELPPLDLTPDEATALLAGVAMSRGSGTQVAAARLTTDTPDSTVPTGPAGLALSLESEHLDAVATAITSRTTIRFDYRTGDGTASTRTLDPWAVGVRNGVGYVLGHDHDRRARRVFRLSRIDARITTVDDPGSFTPPDDVDLASELRGPFGDGVDVHVVVAPHAVGEAESRGARPDGATAVPAPTPDGAEDTIGDLSDPDPDAWVPMVVPDADPVRLVSWLVAAADRVVVTAPADLRTRVRDHLADVLAGLGAPDEPVDADAGVGP